MTTNAQTTLLLVDDETDITDMLAEFFGEHGYATVCAASAAEARMQLAQAAPALAILDIHMPGEDGLALAAHLRETHPATGIIMLTTAAAVQDRIAGLQAADDYVAKPFDLHELLARVQSLLRRLARAEPAAPALRAGEVRFGATTLDLEGRKLIDAEGKDLAITAMEYDLLKVFAEHLNETLSRDQLMEQAHHRGWDVFDRSIDLRVMRLRRKIEVDPANPLFVQTVRGTGYRLVVSP